MKRQAFQPGEIRDTDDNIIREGAYGKHTPLATKDNEGILDYIINNFDAIKDLLNGAVIYADTYDKLPKAGDGTKMYIVKDTGKAYRWDGAKYVLMDGAVHGDTITGADVDDNGFLTLHLSSGKALKTELKPIADTIAARDAAKASADAASASKTAAASSATSAESSKTAAAGSATAAKTSETNAASSARAASTSKDNAAASATAAEASKTAAAGSATAAKTSETHAATSETHAASSETETKQALAEAKEAAAKAQEALGKITGVAKYCGSVTNYADLSSKQASAKVGDVWNVVNADEEHRIKAGDNVIWSGTGWDNLSGFADLSNYPTNADVAKAIMSTTYSGDTVTFIHKDGTQTTATINNVAHATSATNDGDNHKISTTYATKTETHMLARNKAYAVGDIAYSPNLPSYAFLECVTAGTTGNTEPSWTNAVAGGVEKVTEPSSGE